MNRDTAQIQSAAASGAPAPVMPSACQTGGCGSPSSDPRLQPAPPSFGAILVNGVEIDPEAIAQEIQHHPAKSGEAAWQQAGRALAVRELLLQEARRLGIEADPETDDTGRNEIEEEAIIRALLEQQVEPAAASEEECRRYYEAHTHRFRTPDLFEPSHILIEPESDEEGAWAAAEAEARAIAFAVGNSAEAFAAAAREFSKCPTAHQNGSLGQIRRGELVPAVQEAIEKLAEGTAGRDPVRSRFGWHIIRLQRKVEGHTLPFEVVKDKIADMLDARAWAVAAARYTAELARSGQIEGILVDPDSLGIN